MTPSWGRAWQVEDAQKKGLKGLGDVDDDENDMETPTKAGLRRRVGSAVGGL